MNGLLVAFWKPFAAILATILGALGIYAKGRSDAKAKAKTKDLKAELDTRKRMDDADIVGDNPDLARRWLHERGKPERRL